MKKTLSTLLLALASNVYAEDIVSKVVSIEPVTVVKTTFAQDHNAHEILSESYRFETDVQEVAGVKLITCVNEATGKTFRMEVADNYASTLKIGQRILAQVAYK